MSRDPTSGEDGQFEQCGGRHVPEPVEEALAAFRTLSRREGIIPALETSHAIALAGDHDVIPVNLSGRGDEDMRTAAEHFDLGA